MTLQPDHIAVRPCQSGQSNYSVQSDQQLYPWVEASRLFSCPTRFQYPENSAWRCARFLILLLSINQQISFQKMHMLVVWNFLGGVISASRFGGSDCCPSSNRHAVLARGTEGTEQSDVLLLNTTRYFYLKCPPMNFSLQRSKGLVTSVQVELEEVIVQAAANSMLC